MEILISIKLAKHAINTRAVRCAPVYFELDVRTSRVVTDVFKYFCAISPIYYIYNVMNRGTMCIMQWQITRDLYPQYPFMERFPSLSRTRNILTRLWLGKRTTTFCLKARPRDVQFDKQPIDNGCYRDMYNFVC